MEIWKKGVLEAGADGRRVILIGELDLSTVDIAEQALRSAEEEEGASEIVLDLEQLTFIDSTGIVWLLTAMRRHSCATGTTRAVQRVFELTGIADRLPRCGRPPAPRNTQASI